MAGEAVSAVLPRQARRRDRPGYISRQRADGTRARYWMASRALSTAPIGIPARRIPDDATDDEVMRLCRQWTEELRDEPAQRAAWALSRSRHYVSKHLATVYRKRAAEKGWECGIDADWIESKLKSIDDRCEISGLPFEYAPMQKLKKWYKDPMRPSMDRLDNSRGYTPDNIRAVLHCVNIGMNEWGLERYLHVCRAVAAAA